MAMQRSVTPRRLYDYLTWKEFVELVNAALERQGLSQDTEIFYIDTGNFPTRKRLEIGEDQERGWLIISG